MFKMKMVLKPYAAASPAIYKKFGGRYLGRSNKCEVPEGATRSRHVVVEFPDYASALACYHSPEYQANIKVRDAARSLLIFSSWRDTTARSRNSSRRLSKPSEPHPMLTCFN